MPEQRRLRRLPVVVLAMALAACAGTGQHAFEAPDTAPPIEEDPRAEGIRALLAESAWRAAHDLSRTTGYAGRNETRIAIPDELASVTALLRGYGHGRAVDALERDLDRALSLTAAAVLPALRTQIAQLPIRDVDALLQDQDASATRLLCEDGLDAMHAAWIAALDTGLAQSGYATSLAITVAQYNDIPTLADITAPDIRPALEAQGLAGLCHRMAAEEERMRTTPHLRPEGAVTRLLSPPAPAPEPAAPMACMPDAGVANGNEGAPARPATRAERKREAAAARALAAMLATALDDAANGLSRPGAFQRNDALRIGLPPAAQAAADALAAAGQPEPGQRLLFSINAAAEISAARAGPLLHHALANTRFDHATHTLHEDDASATRRYRQQNGDALFAAFATLVADALRRAGAPDREQELVSAHFRRTGEKISFELEPHVRRCLLHGIYLQAGEAERAVRADPGRHGLGRLFRAAR
ncbi:MAG: DUF4197 family protein [Gammaproteobacteria bacterium]